MKRSAPDDVRDPAFDYSWPLEKNIIMGFPELDVHLADDLMPPPRLETEPERDCDGINPAKRRERLANVDWHQHRRISRGWNDLQAALTDTDQKERFAQPAFADVLEYYISNYAQYKKELFAALDDDTDTDAFVRLRIKAFVHHARKIFYSLGRVFDSIVALKDDRSDDLFRRLTELVYLAHSSFPRMRGAFGGRVPGELLPAWAAFVLGRYETSPSTATVEDCFVFFHKQVNDAEMGEPIEYLEEVDPAHSAFYKETMVAAAERDDLPTYDFIVACATWPRKGQWSVCFEFVRQERARWHNQWQLYGYVCAHVHAGPEFMRRVFAMDFECRWPLYAIMSTRQALELAPEITARLERLDQQGRSEHDAVLTSMMQRPLTEGVARFLQAVIPNTLKAPEKMLAWAAASMRLDLLEDVDEGAVVTDDTMEKFGRSWNISAAVQADTVANPVSAANVLATLEFMRRRSLSTRSLYAAEKLRVVASPAEWRVLLAHPLVKASRELHDGLLRLVPEQDDAAALLVIDAFFAAFSAEDDPNQTSVLAYSASQRASKAAIRHILYGPLEDNVRDDIAFFVAKDALIRNLRDEYATMHAEMRALAEPADDDAFNSPSTYLADKLADEVLEAFQAQVAAARTPEIDGGVSDTSSGNEDDDDDDDDDD